MRDLPNLGDKNKEPPLCYPYSVKARALIHAHLSRLELPRLTLKSGEKSPGAGQGRETLISDRDACQKIQIKPEGRPMWVWLKLKRTPKGDFCLSSVT